MPFSKRSNTRRRLKIAKTGHNGAHLSRAGKRKTAVSDWLAQRTQRGFAQMTSPSWPGRSLSAHPWRPSVCSIPHVHNRPHLERVIGTRCRNPNRQKWHAESAQSTSPLLRCCCSAQISGAQLIYRPGLVCCFCKPKTGQTNIRALRILLQINHLGFER